MNRLDTGKPPFDPFAELSKDEFELGNLKSTPDPRSGIQKVDVNHTQLSEKHQRRLQASAERRKRAQQGKRNVENEYARESSTFNGQKYDRHEDIPEWKQSHGEMLKASESLGEQAIDAVMVTQLPKARPIKSKIPGEGGQGQFDRIYVDGDNVYILERKGAGGRRGGRRTKEGIYAEQGTSDYRDDIIENMREYADKADDPELMETVRILENALDEGTLSYLEVSQRVDKTGKLSPKVDVVSFSD